MIFPRVHYAFAEFRGGAGSAPSKYAPVIFQRPFILTHGVMAICWPSARPTSTLRQEQIRPINYFVVNNPYDDGLPG